MAANTDFIGTFMKQFEDQLKQVAEDSLQKYCERYKQDLNEIESSNDKLMKKAINTYHEKRKKHAVDMDSKVDQQLAESKKSYEEKLQDVDEQLLCHLCTSLLILSPII